MDNTITFLNKLMDASAERHKVLANNLANANTPGYVRRDVQFKDALADAVTKGNAEAIRSVHPDVIIDKTLPFRPDGNNVSAHIEMSEMTENQLLYKTATKAMSMKLQTLKKAAAGGGGGGG